MTWFVMLWISSAPGHWLALELASASQAECHRTVPVLAGQLRQGGAHEFVIRCEKRAR